MAPMTSPFPEQGPIFALKAVFVVITLPHPTEPKTGAGKIVSVEPKTVKSNNTASGILGNSRFPKTNGLVLRQIYNLG